MVIASQLSSKLIWSSDIHIKIYIGSWKRNIPQEYTTSFPYLYNIHMLPMIWKRGAPAPLKTNKTIDTSHTSYSYYFQNARITPCYLGKQRCGWWPPDMPTYGIGLWPEQREFHFNQKQKQFQVREWNLELINYFDKGVVNFFVVKATQCMHI